MDYYELESSTVELKSDLPKNEQIIKTIIGFCNQQGGKLVIGVNDDGKIMGIDDSRVNKMLEFIDKAIYEASNPPIIPRIYTQRIGDKSLLIIEVSSGMNKPYYLKAEGIERGVYVRLGRSTLRATEDLIKELKWQSRGIDFEKLPLYESKKEDLGLEKIEKFLRERTNHVKINALDEVLKSYYLIVSEHSKIYPTNAGILLFGNNTQKFFSEAMIICSHFKGISGREAIASIDCEDSLFEQFQKAYAFILGRLNKSFVIRGTKREEEFEIPKEAIREALLNALVHRNYHIKAPIKIAIYDDRIEIFSPGQFVGPLNTQNLNLGITYLRNPSICKVFREAGYIEKLGTGFITIFESYAKRRLMRPQIIEGENFIKCILPRKKDGKMRGQLDDFGMILELFKTKKEITVKDVMQSLGMAKATAVRKMNVLIKTRKIKRSGRTKNIKYFKV